MDESKRPVCPRQRRRVWRPLSHIGLPLRVDHPRRVNRIRRSHDDSHQIDLPRPVPLLEETFRPGTSSNFPDVPSCELSRFKLLLPDDLAPAESADSDEESICEGTSATHGFSPMTMLEGSSLLDTSQEALTKEDSSEVHCSGLSRFKQLSVDDLKPTSKSTDSDEENICEGTSATHGFRSDDDITDDDEGCPFGDPFLEDGFGNITKYRLSDLRKEFTKHLEEVSSEPKTREKKMSKEEKMKQHSDRMELYMRLALKKYNNDENLDESLCFEFEKVLKESAFVEGAYMFYHHFNFAAIQTHSTTCLFFAEVIPHGETCDVTCCKLLEENDNGRCHGCKNQGDSNLRHPASENIYVGGHEDCMCPFLLDSDSEDDSD
ncbi:hypothetical protein ACP4OV_004061 [Aristida adscensionis]